MEEEGEGKRARTVDGELGESEEEKKRGGGGGGGGRWLKVCAGLYCCLSELGCVKEKGGRGGEGVSRVFFKSLSSSQI